MELKIRRADKRAKLPTRAHPTDSGLDLYSIETRTLHIGCRHLFKTGIEIELPKGHEGQVRSRSGLSVKYGVAIPHAPGTVDEGYQGPVDVLLYNAGKKPFLVEEGMRIAQLVISPVVRPEIKEVKSFKKETSRGAGGFGSTGD